MEIYGKTLKNLLQNQNSYDTCHEALATHVLQVCINDYALLTLAYFIACSNLVAYDFELRKLLQSHLRLKLAINNQSDRRFMSLTTN